MQQSNLSNASRQSADRHLLTILLAGLGGSIVFHAAAIAGVTHWWKPVVATIDEPMEITMVDTAPEPPPAKPLPKPTPVVPIVKAPAKVEPKPDLAKPVPIVKVPAKVEPKPAPKAKTPAPTKPLPIVKTASSLDNLPIEREIAKPVSKPVPKSIEPPPKAVVPPAFPDALFKPAQPTAKTPVEPKPKIAKAPAPKSPSVDNRSGLASNTSNRKLATRSTDTPAPTQDEDFGQVAPSKINAPTEEFAPSSSNQSGLAGNPANSRKLGSSLAANNSSPTTEDDNFGAVAPSKIKPPTNDDFIGSSSNQSGLAGKPSNSSKLGSRLAGNTASGSASDDDFGGVAQGNSWRGARAEPGAGLKPPSPPANSSDGGSSGVFGLQCINRCQISGLTDLEDSDGGKDRLRIKIAIDPKGFVTSASIAKSSGNSTIDRAVINGVKQMQFSPPGKIVERVVKANILL
jgi:TonB family protein